MFVSRICGMVTTRPQSPPLFIFIIFYFYFFWSSHTPLLPTNSPTQFPAPPLVLLSSLAAAQIEDSYAAAASTCTDPVRDTTQPNSLPPLTWHENFKTVVNTDYTSIRFADGISQLDFDVDDDICRSLPAEQVRLSLPPCSLPLSCLFCGDTCWHWLWGISNDLVAGAILILLVPFTLLIHIPHHPVWFGFSPGHNHTHTRTNAPAPFTGDDRQLCQRPDAQVAVLWVGQRCLPPVPCQGVVQDRSVAPQCLVGCLLEREGGRPRGRGW